MPNEAKNFVYFQPVLQNVAIVVEGFLVLLDDDFRRGRQVIKLFQDLSELSPIQHVLRVELINQKWTQLIYVNYVCYPRQWNDVRQQLQNLHRPFRQHLHNYFADAIRVFCQSLFVLEKQLFQLLDWKLLGSMCLRIEQVLYDERLVHAENFFIHYREMLVLYLSESLNLFRLGLFVFIKQILFVFLPNLL